MPAACGWISTWHRSAVTVGRQKAPGQSQQGQSHHCQPLCNARFKEALTSPADLFWEQPGRAIIIMGLPGRLGIDRGAVYWGEIIDSCLVTRPAWQANLVTAEDDLRGGLGQGETGRPGHLLAQGMLWADSPVSAPQIQVVIVQHAALTGPQPTGRPRCPSACVSELQWWRTLGTWTLWPRFEPVPQYLTSSDSDHFYQPPHPTEEGDSNIPLQVSGTYHHHPIIPGLPHHCSKNRSKGCPVSSCYWGGFWRHCSAAEGQWIRGKQTWRTWKENRNGGGVAKRAIWNGVENIEKYKHLTNIGDVTYTHLSLGGLWPSDLLLSWQRHPGHLPETESLLGPALKHLMSPEGLNSVHHNSRWATLTALAWHFLLPSILYWFYPNLQLLNHDS